MRNLQEFFQKFVIGYFQNCFLGILQGFLIKILQEKLLDRISKQIPRMDSRRNTRQNLCNSLKSYNQYEWFLNSGNFLENFWKYCWKTNHSWRVLKPYHNGSESIADGFHFRWILKICVVGFTIISGRVWKHLLWILGFRKYFRRFSFHIIPEGLLNHSWKIL